MHKILVVVWRDAVVAAAFGLYIAFDVLCVAYNPCVCVCMDLFGLFLFERKIESYRRRCGSSSSTHSYVPERITFNYLLHCRCNELRF